MQINKDTLQAQLQTEYDLGLRASDKRPSSEDQSWCRGYISAVSVIAMRFGIVLDAGPAPSAKS